MVSFQKVKLGELMLKVTDGSHWSPKEQNIGIPMASVKDMTEFGFEIDKCKKISRDDFRKIEKSDCKPLMNDILIAKDGSYLKYAFVWKKEIDLAILSSIAILRPDTRKINPYYFSKILTTENTKKKMANYVTGSALPRIVLKDFKKMEFELPDLITQTNIATFLSAYDDLIENNEQRIKVLEEIAQLLYTEWFVKFKFPGYEKMKVVDSNKLYGKIPERWEVKKLKEIGKAVTGKTPPTSNIENFDGEVLFIKTPDIHGKIFVIKTEQTLSAKGSELQSSKLLPEKTVFASCIGTLGVIGITSKPSQTNQQINALVLNDHNDYIYFYFFAKSIKQLLIGLGSNGATMGNVNKDKFENIQILYPEKQIRDNFFNIASTYFDEILSLQIRNENLITIRDLLIPQLVTGRRELK